MNHPASNHWMPSRRQAFSSILLLAMPFLFLLGFARGFGLDASELFHDFGVSAFRLAVAYLVALALAWAAAILFSRGKRAGVALSVFDVLQSFPTFAALPLATLAWGPSGKTVVVFLVLTVIWPILFSIVSSLHLVKRDWEEAIEMSRIKGWDYFRLFLLPVSVPGIITGSIVGLGEGWEALVATEMVVLTRDGLGSFFLASVNDIPVTALGILGLLLFIFSLNKLLWLPLMERSHRLMGE
jgi:ABC-type nitrate/sulfonate/bicarbonate transport system permease component